jgi:hypothetical protein
MNQTPEIYTVRKSWVSAVKRGELEIEHERRDLFSDPPSLFHSFEAAQAAARKLAAAEAAEDNLPPLYGWIICDPGTYAATGITLIEVVPIAVESDADTTQKKSFSLAETFDAPVEENVPDFARERVKALRELEVGDAAALKSAGKAVTP